MVLLSDRWAGWRFAGCVALLALFTTGCGEPAANGDARRGPPPNQAAYVVTDAATIQPLGVDIEAVGTARANESVEVTSKSSNIVTAIRFQEGALVRRNEVLVELDSAEARAALAEAEAALADSASQFKRSRDLYAQQALSVSQLEQIEAMQKGNLARVEAARARLADTVIRASFDGRVGLRRVSVGSLISPGTVITTLDDSSIIKLDFTVPETYVYLLERDLPVIARAAGLPDRKFEGRITHLDSRVDPVTRSIAVRAEVSNRDGQLRPGMFMTVALQGKVVPTLLVPEAAIVPEQGNAYVFVVQNGIAAKRPVSTGRRRPGEVEVTSGLKAGERVVIEGTQNMRDGVHVVEQSIAADGIGS